MSGGLPCLLPTAASEDDDAALAIPPCPRLWRPRLGPVWASQEISRLTDRWISSQPMPTAAVRVGSACHSACVEDDIRASACQSMALGLIARPDHPPVRIPLDADRRPAGTDDISAKRVW